MACPTSAAAILALVAVVFGVLRASGQSTPKCVVQLVPCYQFLKSTSKVPDSCCNPMRDAVENQRDCLCKLYQTPGLLQTYNINITQVFGLTKACGVTASTDFCAASVAESPSSSPAAIPGKDQNRASSIGKAAWGGLFGIQMFVVGVVVML
ncbi:hypothetical protein MLD38_038469 [Melastoma candidum]|uniref:Uncharacterized protein n=1 Tax=Melastoma candidum TaxID=119954 RepID=A0ACB9KZM6_9MYRT|nr:hypothetical protein MLD38_038469 [Melastoma candidum]